MELTMLLMVSVFIAGLLSFFSPYIFPVLPVYLGILLDSDDSRSITIFGKKLYWYGIVKTLAFISGLSTIFIILGYGAGLLGNILYAAWFRYLLGAFVILLGIHQMEIVTIKKLQFQKSVAFQNKKDRNAVLNAFCWELPLALVGRPVLDQFLARCLP